MALSQARIQAQNDTKPTHHRAKFDPSNGEGSENLVIQNRAIAQRFESSSVLQN
jgi:hypothetical protein